MFSNNKVAYQRLNVQRVPEKSIILKLVLPLIVGCFVLFCIVGLLTPHNPTHRNYNQYVQTWSNHPPVDETKLLETLKSLLNCKSSDANYRIETRGEFYVLKNFISPRRRPPLECHESITYTTHGDYRFLDNVVPLLERWQGPLSLAVYAPGDEFGIAIEVLRYLIYCDRQSYLVEEFATVHLYFDFDRVPPKPIQFYRELLQKPPDCPLNNASFLFPTLDNTFNHTYPVNVGRNIARDAAQTHFVLASDIELYPNPGFIEMFLQMVINPAYQFTLNIPSVYVLPVFEVSDTCSVPENKTELLSMLNTGEAIKFHEKICAQCHTVPNYDEWLQFDKPNQTMDILSMAKREGRFDLWEPIYVGTKREPQYQERLNWEGKFDKMTQGYIMCVQGYNFHILDNGFLVHKPGFKNLTEAARPDLERRQRKFVEEVIYKELKVLYGENKHCRL
ncbi:beta-1,4-glucuronyltransferase 1-like isoform X1 [Armigeres subalbatus]|uniref:beta-1,4-glucuronyltransferase 1-like isoform X1 n=1 Tax=Armigeres subalbatus TaxID=124917 RepID=UPI002ED5E259